MSLAMTVLTDSICNEDALMVCELANQYLAPELGGSGDEKTGIVERQFTAELLREWLSRRGTRLFIFRDTDGKLAGFFIGCMPGRRMKEEDGSCKLAVDAFNRKHGEKRRVDKAFWVYYLVTPKNSKAYGVRISIAVGKWLRNMGINLIVADFMVPTAECPHTCKAGERIMMKLLGFESTGEFYDNAKAKDYLAGQRPYMKFEIVVLDLTKKGRTKGTETLIKVMARVFPGAI